MTLELSMISDDGTVGARITIPHFHLIPNSEVQKVVTRMSLQLKRDLTQYTVANASSNGEVSGDA